MTFKAYMHEFISKIIQGDITWVLEELELVVVASNEMWYNFWFYGFRIHHREYQRAVRGLEPSIYVERCKDIEKRRRKRYDV